MKKLFLITITLLFTLMPLTVFGQEASPTVSYYSPGTGEMIQSTNVDFDSSADAYDFFENIDEDGVEELTSGLVKNYDRAGAVDLADLPFDAIEMYMGIDADGFFFFIVVQYGSTVTLTYYHALNSAMSDVEDAMGFAGDAAYYGTDVADPPSRFEPVELEDESPVDEPNRL